MSYRDVAVSLEKARSYDELIEACQQIQHVADLQQRERLGGIVRRRLDEFRKH